MQIAANNAPSVFDINSRLEPPPKAEQPKVEPKEEPKEEPRPEQPSIVSKWTLVDYDAEEKPDAGCAAAVHASQTPGSEHLECLSNSVYADS